MLPNPIHTVIMVGYQAVGTRGRNLVDGAEFIRMHGKDVKVSARIEQIQSFSVHADSKELIDWLRTASEEPSRVFAVHGEPEVADEHAKNIQSALGWDAVAPKANSEFPI
jgi:metallo-beta-lactamase family protein